MHKVNGRDIRAIVAQPKWQALRASFVGTWKHTPDDNVVRLRQYLDEEGWQPDAVVRVLNYLTGTAFRIGLITSPAIEALRYEVRTVNERNRAP